MSDSSASAVPFSHGPRSEEWKAAHEALKAQEETWRALQFDGIQNDQGRLWEMRRCPGCGSTINRAITTQAAMAILQVACGVHERSMEALGAALAHESTRKPRAPRASTVSAVVTLLILSLAPTAMAETPDMSAVACCADPTDSASPDTPQTRALVAKRLHSLRTDMIYEPSLGQRILCYWRIPAVFALVEGAFVVFLFTNRGKRRLAMLRGLLRGERS